MHAAGWMLDIAADRHRHCLRWIENFADAVMLSTTHSAKGLEWDTVFMIGMEEDGVLPHTNSEDIEEERRVAYVSVTRARQRLGLTYSDERYGERLEPSPFLSEIAGRDRRSCTWTRPKQGRADDRLLLLTSDERQHHVGQGESVPTSHRPNRDRHAAAVRTGKGAKCQGAEASAVLTEDSYTTWLSAAERFPERHW